MKPVRPSVLKKLKKIFFYIKMNIFDNILDNYLYLYYTETYPRYDSLQGCSISFETQVCQG